MQRRSAATLGILFAAACLLAPPARAASQLQPEMARLGMTIKKLLEGRGEEAIAVGDFTGPAQLDSNFGPGLQEELTFALEALKVKVDRKAKCSAKGEYLTVADKNVAGLVAVRVIVRVFDQFANELVSLPMDLRGTGDVVRMLAPTVSLPAKGDRRERNETLQESLDRPSAHLSGSRVCTRKDSPFAVELLVGSQPRPVRGQGGQAFVDIKRDEIYEIRLHNTSRLEAAATVHIDGLDVFHFSQIRNPTTGRPRYTHVVVPPNGSVVLKGWHRTNHSVLSFLVTEYGKGAASITRQSRGKVGVITVTFAFAWAGETPEEERGSRDGGNETGLGPPQRIEAREVQRQIGVVRDVVSVRYTR